MHFKGAGASGHSFVQLCISLTKVRDAAATLLLQWCFASANAASSSIALEYWLLCLQVHSARERLLLLDGGDDDASLLTSSRSRNNGVFPTVIAVRRAAVVMTQRKTERSWWTNLSYSH